MVDVSKLNAPECKEAQKNMGAASTAFRDGMGSGVLPSAEDMGKLNAAKTAVTNACGGLDYGCTQMLISCLPDKLQEQPPSTKRSSR